METHLSTTTGLDGRVSPAAPTYPISIAVLPQLSHRNRLTGGFRFILAIPHLLLVGGPVVFGTLWDSNMLGASGGALGAVAAVCALIAWFAIVFGGEYPEGLWKLATFYVRWRVRAVAYVTLLRDDYPPFGSGAYPILLTLPKPKRHRDRWMVALRPILVLPHLIVLWFLGVAWAVTTLIGWFSVLIYGSFPESLYTFGVGMLRWTTRVEGYALLLCDEYPPFSLD